MYALSCGGLVRMKTCCFLPRARKICYSVRCHLKKHNMCLWVHRPAGKKQEVIVQKRNFWPELQTESMNLLPTLHPRAATELFSNVNHKNPVSKQGTELNLLYLSSEEKVQLLLLLMRIQDWTPKLYWFEFICAGISDTAGISLLIWHHWYRYQPFWKPVVLF